MDGLIIGGGRGGTFEKIDTRSTILGIALPSLLMIGIKLLMLLCFLIALTIIGQLAGPGLLAGGFLYALLRPYDYESKSKLWIVFIFGAVISLFTFVIHDWPLPIMWICFAERGCFISWRGNPAIRASGWLVLLRWSIGFVLVWMLWWPYKWSMWALMAELLMPKYRESTFTRADVSSMPQPEGMRLRGQQMRTPPVQPNAHIPASAGGGGPEIVGE